MTAKRAAKRGRGRPTKLTPAVARKIIRIVRAGNYRYVAAAAAGVTADRFTKWMSSQGAPYEDFRQAVIEAEKAVEIELVSSVVRASKKNPDVALKYLERKFHDRWGRKDRLQAEVSGRDGAPIAVTIYLPKEEASDETQKEPSE